MLLKRGIGSEESWHFLMRTVHEYRVPKEAKQKEETKRCNECDEEFFPVHNFFRLRFLLSPSEPEKLDLKTLGRCRSKS
jgi:hypothetical protein